MADAELPVAGARVIVAETLLRDAMRHWFSFQNALSSGSQEEAEAEYEKLAESLSEYQFSLEKATKIAARNTAQADAYLDTAQAQDAQVRALEGEVEAMRAEYRAAKAERQKREELEMLAQMIQKHASTEDSERQVLVLQQELAELEATKARLEERVAARNKQFQRALHAVADLQEELREEEALEAGERMDEDEDEVPEEEGEEGEVTI